MGLRGNRRRGDGLSRDIKAIESCFERIGWVLDDLFYPVPLTVFRQMMLVLTKKKKKGGFCDDYNRYRYV